MGNLSLQTVESAYAPWYRWLQVKQLSLKRLLVCFKKSRDATAEKLKQGDITNQKLRDVIVRKSFKPVENMKLRGTKQDK